MGFRSTSWPGISVKDQIRGSASARLGQVQGGSRRMRPPRSLPTGHGGGAHTRCSPGADKVSCDVALTRLVAGLVQRFSVTVVRVAGSCKEVAWPAVSLAGSYELLVWLIRISGTAGPGPSAEHLGEGAACRAVAGSAPAAGSEQDSRSQREVPGQARQPADRVAGRPAIPAGGQRDDAVADAGAVNDAAVAAYRLIVQAGNPLSERKLAQLFGRTSRRWGASQDHRRPASIAAPGLATVHHLDLVAGDDGLAEVTAARAAGIRGWGGSGRARIR
jgi:hypothetical protein